MSDHEQQLVDVSMSLPEETVAIVRSMARRADVSMAEVVRRAILTDKLLHDEMDKGAEVLIKLKNNELRQIIFR